MADRIVAVAGESGTDVPIGEETFEELVGVYFV